MSKNLEPKGKISSAFPLSPITLLAFTLLPPFMALFISPSKFGRPLKSFGFNIREFLIVVLLVLAFFIGYRIAHRRSEINQIDFSIRLKEQRNVYKVIISYARSTLLIGAIAHTVLFINGALSVGLTRRSSGWLPTIPIVTTLCHVSILGFLLALVVKIKFPNEKNVSSLTIFVSLSLVIARTILNNERLALISLILPLIVYFLFNTQSSLRKRLFGALMLVAPLSILFPASEYFRSWDTNKRFTDLGFLQYSLERFTNYYVTAQTNGSLYLNNYGQEFWFPIIILGPLVAFPFFGQILSKFATETYDWFTLLSFYNNSAEYNNINAFLVIAGDLGVMGALPFLYILGMYFGKIYARAEANELTSQIIYASLVLVLIELPRVYLLTAPRMLPIYFVLFFLTRSLKRASDFKKSEMKLR